MPNTIYTVSRAARMSSGSLDSESWKAAAVPWKLAWMVDGKPMLRSALSITVVASPSETPGARLKEIVADGYCPWWLTPSELFDGPKCARDIRGGDSEPRGRIAVNHDAGLQSLILLVGVDVAQLWQRAQFLKQPRCPGVHLGQVFALQRVLVLGLTHAPADGQILRRLHVQGRTRNHR